MKLIGVVMSRWKPISCLFEVPFPDVEMSFISPCQELRMKPASSSPLLLFDYIGMRHLTRPSPAVPSAD